MFSVYERIRPIKVIFLGILGISLSPRAFSADPPPSSVFCDTNSEIDRGDPASVAAKNCPTAFGAFAPYDGAKNAQFACYASVASIKKAKALMCQLTNQVQALAQKAQADAQASVGNQWSGVRQGMGSDIAKGMDAVIEKAKIAKGLLKTRGHDLKNAGSALDEAAPSYHLGGRGGVDYKAVSLNRETKNSDLPAAQKLLDEWSKKISDAQSSFEKAKADLLSQNGKFQQKNISDMKSADGSTSANGTAAGGDPAKGDGKSEAAGGGDGSDLAKKDSENQETSATDAASKRVASRMGGKALSQSLDSGSPESAAAGDAASAEGSGGAVNDALQAQNSASAGAGEAANAGAASGDSAGIRAVAADSFAEATPVTATDAAMTAVTQGPGEAVSSAAGNWLAEGSGNTVASVVNNPVSKTFISDTSGALVHGALTGDFSAVATDAASSMAGDAFYATTSSGAGTVLGSALSTAGGAATILVTSASPVNLPEVELEQIESETGLGIGEAMQIRDMRSLE